MRVHAQRFLLGFCLLPASLTAQQLIGYVSTKDADVTGATDRMNDQAVLSGSAAVTARDHTAPIKLSRGGTVRVCQTSILNLTESKSAQRSAPLLLSLDRGAIEVQMLATSTDALMTPDLHFSVRGGGPLDLRMRLARNGDTCVENRGTGAPLLAVSDPFGEAMYELRPGQHVLFEHGSVHEVVDHEAEPCGCPDSDATLSSSNHGSLLDNGHPFPAAVSEGLAPAPEVPQAPPGEVHAQVTDRLSYSAQTTIDGSNSSVVPGAATVAPATEPAKRGLFHAVGHFFKKLFASS